MTDDHGRREAWWQDWRGEYAAIIAGGPSVKNVNVELLKNRVRVIAINESHRLAPWADILYGCEAIWWKVREREVAKFAGLKLSCEVVASAHQITVAKKPNWRTLAEPWLNEFVFDTPGVVGAGGNGGFQMVNLAAQFGASGIALIGFDMRLDSGAHWHGLHPSPLRNPTAERFFDWVKWFDAGAPVLKARGIDVVNCSPVSALTAFPKLTLEQTLERWRL